MGPAPDDISRFHRILEGRMGEVNRNSRVPKFIRRVEMMQKRSIMYYQQQDSEPFLTIVVALPTWWPAAGLVEIGLRSLQDPAGQYNTTVPLSYCRLELYCLYSDFISHTPEGEFFEDGSISNIECAGHKDHFPEPIHDPVIQRVSVKMVAAGAEHIAAVKEDGSLCGRGWGNLDLGDRNDCLVPEKVSMVNKGKIPFYPLNPPTSLSRAYAVQNQGKNEGKKKREFGDFGGRASW